MKQDFGLASLGQIRPSAASADAAPQEIDRAGERLGFQPREVRRRRKRVTMIQADTDQLNLRAEIDDIDCFIGWCEQNRWSYREGFARLMRPLRGKDAGHE
jgi:hypothetical protein